MIPIRRPVQAPAILLTDGSDAVERLRQAVEQRREKLSFNSEIYGHPDVKLALRQMQHEKCCFCEALIGKEGDVEHFRPKAAFRQLTADPLEKPGYWWLAYTWSNLLLCCTHCNQREKKNLFPLENPTERVRLPEDPLATERPLFLNPAEETDLGAHLSFDRYDLRYLSERGRVTVETLGLNDENRGMYLRRKKRWEQIQECQQAVARREELENTPNGRAVVALFEKWLQDWQQPTAEFSAMASCALRDVMTS